MAWQQGAEQCCVSEVESGYNVKRDRRVRSGTSGFDAGKPGQKPLFTVGTLGKAAHVRATSVNMSACAVSFLDVELTIPWVLSLDAS